MTDYETITASRTDGVGLITLNRPESLNALSSTLFGEFYAEFESMDGDPDVRAIVVTGAGDRAFSAGADIKEMKRLADEGVTPPSGRFAENGWNLANSRTPTIGALNGLCYGGGAVMASSFDIRIGCERTTFRFLAVTYGRLNSTWTLPNVVGMAIAKELIFTGRVVEPEEALEYRLLNRLVAPEQVLPSALEIAAVIAGNDPRMVQGAKRLLHKGIGAGYRRQLDNERNAGANELKATSIEEGFKDFIERKGL